MHYNFIIVLFSDVFDCVNLLRSIVSLANYFIVASNNGANWNLVFFKCHLCLVERFAHKQFVVIEYIHAANLSMPGHKCNIKRIRLLVFIIRGMLFINLALNAVNNL